MAVCLGRVRLHEGGCGAVAEAVGAREGGELLLARDRRDGGPAAGAISAGGGRISRGRSFDLQREQAAAQQQRAPRHADPLGVPAVKAAAADHLAHDGGGEDGGGVGGALGEGEAWLGKTRTMVDREVEV